MKLLLLIIIILFFQLCSLFTYSQTDISSRTLTTNEIDLIFSYSVINELEIKFPIFRVYEYKDKLGKHYLVLTENGNISIENPNNDSIHGFCLSELNDKLNVDWKISDNILKQGNEISEEFSIWFWTKYLLLEDIDNDGIIDPIVIYGTSGMNGTDDGRLIIISYFNKTKSTIYHQNGSLDDERNTKVDSLFYKLPINIQEKVKSQIQKMMDDNNIIFPRGWEESMLNKELMFDEK